MPSSGMLRLVALVRIDVSKELNASFFSVPRIGEFETTLAITAVCFHRDEGGIKFLRNVASYKIHRA
jgi:hypothetical protein